MAFNFKVLESQNEEDKTTSSSKSNFKILTRQSTTTPETSVTSQVSSYFSNLPTLSKKTTETTTIPTETTSTISTENTMEESTSPYKLSGETKLETAPEKDWGFGFIGDMAKAAYESVKGTIENIATQVDDLFSSLGEYNLNDYEEISYERGKAAEETGEAIGEKEAATNLGIKPSTTLERAVGLGETAVATAMLHPSILKFTTELQAAKEVPILGELIAEKFDWGVSKVGQAGSWVLAQDIEGLRQQGIISDETAETVTPLANELGAFIAQLIGFKTARIVLKGVKPITEKLPMKETTKTKVSTAAQVGLGVAIQPFSTAYGLSAGLIRTKILQRKSDNIAITPQEGTKIIEEVKTELPAEVYLLEKPTELPKIGKSKETLLLTEGAREKTVKGEGWTMSDKVNVEKVILSKKLNDYRTALRSYNKNPTPTKLKNVLRTKETMEKSIATLNTLTTRRPVEIKPIDVTPIVEKLGGKKTTEAFVKPQEAVGEVEMPKTAETTIEATKLTETEPTQIEQKVSGVAKSIEQKAIERGWVDKEGNKLAEFDGTTFEKQEKLTSDLIKDIEKTRKILRGEEQLPDGMKGSALIAKVEEYLKENPNPEIIKELLNSDLATKVSEAASEVSLARMRETDSPTFKAQEIKKARQERKSKLTKDEKTDKEKMRENLKEKVKKENKKIDWVDFISKIEC